MGIGRFAFTPLMPLMQRDGLLDVTTGTAWAAANYLGYLIGALTASFFGRHPWSGLRIGLVGVVLTTGGMAWANASSPWAGGLLRGSAGVFSAWVLVCASAWCLPLLARTGSAAKAGWVYTGVGIGIAATGVLVWLGGQQSVPALWMALGLLAALSSAYVLLGPSPDVATRNKPGATLAPPETLASGRGCEHVGLVLCYGAFGFGYIIPATYLPTMARQLVSNPLVFGLTWPIFGTAAAISVVLVSRLLAEWPRRTVWAGAQGIMAVGTLLPLLHQNLWVLAASAVLVGGTFMVATMAGLQLGREKMPANPTPLLAQMTSGFAAGQIAGPLLVRFLGSHAIFGLDALNAAHAAATLVLGLSACWLGFAESRHVDP